MPLHRTSSCPKPSFGLNYLLSENISLILRFGRSCNWQMAYPWASTRCAASRHVEHVLKLNKCDDFKSLARFVRAIKSNRFLKGPLTDGSKRSGTVVFGVNLKRFLRALSLRWLCAVRQMNHAHKWELLLIKANAGDARKTFNWKIKTERIQTQMFLLIIRWEMKMFAQDATRGVVFSIFCFNLVAWIPTAFEDFKPSFLTPV